MKTERELFLEWLKKEYPMMYQWYSDGLEEWKTKVEYMFVAWQASAPREGYVVVPKDPTCEMVREGFKEMCVVDMRDFSDESAVNIYKAMLEAVEK